MLTDNLAQQVRDIFNDAQFGAAGHRKLVQSLRCLHITSAEEGSDGERDFFLSLVHCLNVLLAVKRSEEAVTRCIRFLVGFIVLSAERDEASVLGGTTPTIRLIENLMVYALEGIDSKERLVRVRLGQLMVACVSAVDELSDKVWNVFREKMTERLFDKEAAVRVQAVHAMARLQALSLSSDDDGGGQLTILDVFLELLSHDPSPDVRKAVLGQIEVVNGTTLEPILQRRQDVDVGVRRFFYQKKMSEIDVRTLSISQRDAVLRSGLRDRDASVRRACVEMVFGHWIKTTNNNLIMLLLSLDVIRNVEVAEAALQSFYEMVPDMFTSFPRAYFENLTPETAIALRVYCERVGGERAQELLPEITELVSYMRVQYTAQLAGSEEEVREESDFVLHELFKVAKLRDRSDEVGRRVLQELIVEMLSNLALSDQTFSAALDLLIHLTPELDGFLQICGQLVADLHELYSLPDGPLAPADNLQRSLETLTLREDVLAVTEDVRIMAQLRCQQVVAAAFKLPGLSVLAHPVLLDLVNDVVIPAVNSAYAAVQTKGLIALGLACLLSRDLALEYLQLFLDFFAQGQDETRIVSLQMLFDLAFMYGGGGGGERTSAGQSTLEEPPQSNEFIALTERIAASLYDPDAEIQTMAVQGFSKLLLNRILTDLGVLTGLFQLYFHRATVRNPVLRQSLTYFFQAFAYSSSLNQDLVAQAFVPAMEAWLQSSSASSQAQSNLTPLQVASQLLELCDPLHLLERAERRQGMHAHAVVAEQVAWAALHQWEDGKGKGKLYAQILARLRIDSSWPIRRLKRLLFVVGHLIRVVSDKVTQTSLKKTVALLVELDDPSQLLEPEDLTELRRKLDQVVLPDKPRPVPAKATRPTKPAALSTVNMMDEIHDLLD